MNSFKKVSLIIAAALTSTMLVSTAANAATTTLTVAGSAATGGTVATAPVALPVPADNSVDTADVLKIVVSGSDITGTSITAVATNASLVSALATSTAPVTASSGSSSLTLNVGTGTVAEFYVYTKTTAVGTVSFNVGGNTTTYYVQGIAGALNSISLTAPVSGAAGTIATLKVAGYDVFGNLKSGSAINTLVSSNGAATVTALTTDTAVATLGTKEQTVTLPASGSVVVTAYATVATAITGLAAPVGSVVATVAVRDFAGELASKIAELATANAALKAAQDALAAEKAGRALDSATAKAAAVSATAAADLAKATYIAEYNSLAKKWNAKNPKAKVALKK